MGSRKWLKKRKRANKNKAKKKKWTKKALRAAVSSTHESLEEAIAADIIDVIPVAGDAANALRVIDAAQQKDPMRFGLQAGDYVIGLLPIIGTIGDLVTPTNTLVFVLKKQKLDEELERISP